MLYDVGTRDSRSIMDVAVFRLSKRDRRAGEVIRYELPDGHVEVSAGPAGWLVPLLWMVWGLGALVLVLFGVAGSVLVAALRRRPAPPVPA